MEYEQNLRTLPLPIVLFDLRSNALMELLPLMPTVLQLLSSLLPPAMYVVNRDGSVDRLLTPRE